MVYELLQRVSVMNKMIHIRARSKATACSEQIVAASTAIGTVGDGKGSRQVLKFSLEHCIRYSLRSGTTIISKLTDRSTENGEQKRRIK